jgi:anthranilate phosphoribosyltransferase
MSDSPDVRMRGYLQRIATGPQLSKDLTADEVQDAVASILRGETDPVRAAVFLIALRMKRETVDENIGALRALRAATLRAIADVDELVDLADPYDGVARHLPASPFLPAVLAASGVPAVCHGCRELAPKRGVTTHRVLQAAGVAVAGTPADAAARVADPEVGWAYVGVERFCPPLAALAGLRERIVKRPLLSTLEKLLGPVVARGRTHLVVGWVHKGYDELLVALAREAGFATALAVKGVEGGVIPSLSAATHALGYDGVVRVDPADVGIEPGPERATPVPEGAGDVMDVAARAAAAGIAALEGAPGPTRDMLVHGGAMVLVHVGRAADRAEAAARVRAVLDDGSARARFC